MKRILAVAILGCAVLANPIGATSVCANTQSDDPIASIRRNYTQINRRAPKYKKVKKELSGFSAEGGELIAYFDGPAIVKLFATYYGETGRSTEEYYYDNGKLIFVLRKDFRYNRPLTGKVVRTTVERFYFDNDKLIRWLDESGKQVAADSSEFQEKQKDYLETSKLLTEGARSKNRTIESNQ